jgi:hypothetical protein
MDFGDAQVLKPGPRIDRNAGRLVGHHGSQEPTGKGPKRQPVAVGVPIEQGLRMAAPIEVTRANEEHVGM